MSPKIEPLQIRDDKVLEALFNNKITEIKENTFSRIFKERVAFVLQDKRDIEFVELTLKLLVLVASSLYLLNYFTWIHYGLHIVLHVNLATSYVLMLHCVNHKQTYKSDYFYLNWIVPYFIAPFLGQVFLVNSRLGLLFTIIMSSTITLKITDLMI